MTEKEYERLWRYSAFEPSIRVRDTVWAHWGEPSKGARTLFYGYDRSQKDKNGIAGFTPTVHIYYDGSDFVIYRYDAIKRIDVSIVRTRSLTQEHLPKQAAYVKACDFYFARLCLIAGLVVGYKKSGLGSRAVKRFEQTGFFGELCDGLGN
jgi:hypothetical protein